MPRQAREISPTGYYHIMMRGINRDYIYQSMQDKAYFVKLLGEDVLLELAAYCLMDNHVHLVLQTQHKDLSVALRKLNVKYAMHYNYTQDRVGHVFQNRYRSEVVADDRYLAQVIRYVHNNPVKAALVTDARQYRWSSYNEYCGSEAIISTKQKQRVLDLFPLGLDAFKAFHREKDKQEYLDTAAEIEQQRLSRARDIIADYCQAHGLADYGYASAGKHPAHAAGIITALLQGASLSHRKLSDLLQVNVNVVHAASKTLAQA